MIRSWYHATFGEEPPEFPDGVETRRVLYLDVHLQSGPQRAGGTGQITSLNAPFCRALIDRFLDKLRRAREVQRHWIANRAKSYVPPLDPKPCPMELELALVGSRQYVTIPVMRIPYPEPLVLETHGDFEKAHGDLEADLIDFMNLAFPRGLSKARSSDVRARFSYEELMTFKHDTDTYDYLSAETRMAHTSTIGLQRTVRWLRIMLYKVYSGTFHPLRNLGVQSRDKIEESLFIVENRPGLLGTSDDISGVKNPRPKIPTAWTPRVGMEGLGPPGGCSGALRCGVAPIGTDKLDIFGLC